MIELPSYNITYTNKGSSFKVKMMRDIPHFLRTIKREVIAIKEIVNTEQVSGIISDNRFGVRHTEVPSVFMTHQLRVISGTTTWLTSKLHQNIISKFNECWVPDHSGLNNLSGRLGHVENIKTPIRYLGPLSRFNKVLSEKKYNLLVLLSGPEPQRTILEKKLFFELKDFKGKILFIRGKVENEKNKIENENITVQNFMTSKTLEKAINQSELILSRSGYTTIMDLAKLGKKAFFIPTPGQFEQEYLAKKFNKEKIAPYCNQKNFNISKLKNAKDFSGFKSINHNVNYNELFNLF